MVDFPTFRHVVVLRPNGRILGVHWALNPHSWPHEDLRFVIFRSNSPTGPWDEVGVADEGRFDYTDSDVSGAAVHRSYYYIVRCASVSGKGYSDSPIQRLEHDLDNIAIEMIRKKNLFLTVRGGVSIAVIPRRSFGPKCSRCYNVERGVAEDPDCPVCYGTGFSGGYLNPVYVPGLLNPPKEAIIEAGLKYEPFQIYIEIANWPMLHPRDVIVDRRMGIRYRVDQVSPFTHRMAPISQSAMLLRVDENDVLYDLPIPAAPRSLDARSWDLVTRDQPHEHLRDVPNRASDSRY